MIERIAIKRTLKAGKNVWEEGTVLNRKDGPFPSDILEEVRLNRGTVEVLERSKRVPKTEKLAVSKASPTMVSQHMTSSEIEVQPQPTTPLIRRKL